MTLFSGMANYSHIDQSINQSIFIQKERTEMATTEGLTVICTYRVRKGEEQKFEALLKEHWPTLRKLNMVTEKPR